MNARLSTLAVQQEFVKSDLQSKKKKWTRGRFSPFVYVVRYFLICHLYMTIQYNTVQTHLSAG